MTDSFPLPLEGLRVILRILAVQEELSTLASLLRVNKYVCLVTLPFIYGDPFTWLGRLSGEKMENPKDTYNRLPALVRLLLRDVPEMSCTGKPILCQC